MKHVHFSALALAAAAALLAGSAWMGAHGDGEARQAKAKLAQVQEELDAQKAAGASIARELVEERQRREAAERELAAEQEGQNSNGAVVTVVDGQATVSYGGAEQGEDDQGDAQDDAQEEPAPCAPAPRAKAPAKAKAAGAQQPAGPGAGFAAGAVESADDLASFQAAVAGPERTMVVFHALWCRHCKDFLPVARKWAEATGAKLVLVDAERNPEAWATANGRGYPTTAVYSGGAKLGSEAGDLGARGLREFAAKWAAKGPGAKLAAKRAGGEAQPDSKPSGGPA